MFHLARQVSKNSSNYKNRTPLSAKQDSRRSERNAEKLGRVEEKRKRHVCSSQRKERKKNRGWLGRLGRQEEERLSLSNGQLVDSNTFHHPYLLNLTLLSTLCTHKCTVSLTHTHTHSSSLLGKGVISRLLDFRIMKKQKWSGDVADRDVVSFLPGLPVATNPSFDIKLIPLKLFVYIRV